MKKLLIYTVIIILIPFIIITILLKDENKYIKFKINNNIKVKREDNSVIAVDFEKYIIGVVAAEMPANFDIEALKAQSVAARTYILKKLENNNKEYDILDSVLNQVYLDENQMKNKWKDDYEKYYSKIKNAVDSTKGQYLTYKGDIIDAFFFSTSSGKTENSEEVFTQKLPYLRSVDSAWDEISPAFNEINTFSLEDFYKKLNLQYNSNLNIKILEKTSTGRVKKLSINNIDFSADTIKKTFNLKSTFFEINNDNETVYIKTKGYGHGVGMSQYGAQAMALKGYKYDKILKYYYQNVNISNL